MACTSLADRFEDFLKQPENDSSNIRRVIIVLEINGRERSIDLYFLVIIVFHHQKWRPVFKWRL